MVDGVVEVSTNLRSKHAENSQPDLERCPCRWGGLFFEHLFENLKTDKGGSRGERSYSRRRSPD